MAEPIQLDFKELLARIQSGDNEAIGQLYQSYSKDVHRVVRRKLHSSLRRRYDSDDFVQSVWATFVDLPQTDYVFDSPEKLVAFLSRVAYNKVIQTTRKRLGTAKHDLRRETSFDGPTTTEGRSLAERLPWRGHTPSQFVIADERWAKIIQGQSPGHVQVLELLRDGHNHSEIMQKLGISFKVIRRLLHRLEHFRDQE